MSVNMQIHLDKINEMLLKTGKRNPSFLKMIEHIGRIDNPLIIETGCARQENNYDGDGMSTLIFNEFSKIKGEFWSVDINPDNIEFAKKYCDNTHLVCSDSVKFLYDLNKELVRNNRKIDLLYLDSYDFDMGNPHPSSLHHILELTAIMPSLREGTMICVDDNFGNIGKGGYVHQFMLALGKERVYDGYQWIWIL